MGSPMRLAMCLITCSLSCCERCMDVGGSIICMCAYRRDELVVCSHCMKVEQRQSSCCDTVRVHTKHNALHSNDTLYIQRNIA